MEGRVPLHTLRADIDYAASTAGTTYGCIGVKVWICKGTILDRGEFTPEREEQRYSGSHPESVGRRGGEKRGKRKPQGRVRRDQMPRDNKGQRKPRPSQKPDAAKDEKAE